MVVHASPLIQVWGKISFHRGLSSPQLTRISPTAKSPHFRGLRPVGMLVLRGRGTTSQRQSLKCCGWPGRRWGTRALSMIPLGVRGCPAGKLSPVGSRLSCLVLCLCLCPLLRPRDPALDCAPPLAHWTPN